MSDFLFQDVHRHHAGGPLPQTDEEVYAFFRENGSQLTADTLILLYRMQREAFGKTVLEAYRLTLMEYVTARGAKDEG